MVQPGVTPQECVFVRDGGSYELGGGRALDISTVMMAGPAGRLAPEKAPACRKHADYVITDLHDPPAESRNHQNNQRAW
jgi:hypothetical protein